MAVSYILPLHYQVAMLRTSMLPDHDVVLQKVRDVQILDVEANFLVVAGSRDLHDDQIPEVVENRACRDDRDVDLQGVVQNVRGIYLRNICHLPDLYEVVELVSTNFVYPEVNLPSALRTETP